MDLRYKRKPKSNSKTLIKLAKNMEKSMFLSIMQVAGRKVLRFEEMYNGFFYRCIMALNLR